jgi:hypothetical protein
MAISTFSIMSQTSQIRLFDTSLRPPIFSLAHIALAPMIEIGSLEWMDMTDSYCIHQCIDFDMYSSIHINLCYAVWSAVLFASMAKSPIW